MTISAKMIADSISPEGVRLSTLQLRYPRFIHAEFMTHRQFSRNASSSRAVPVSRLIEDVEDPAIPIYWGKNQPGMQAGKEHDDLVIIRKPMAMVTYDGGMEVEWWGDSLPKEAAWLVARDKAVEFAEAFATAGYHKQIVNRLLEPFSHINVVVTATEWENFFALRDHPDAEPHIRDLARAMREAMDASEPTPLQPGAWHLPYVTREDAQDLHYKVHDVTEALRKISAARCARVSYKTHDGGDPSIAKDLDLFERLVGSRPLHASPTEHQATPDKRVTYAVSSTGSFEGEFVEYREVTGWKNPELHGNFRGWIQHRKLIPGECADSTFPD